MKISTTIFGIFAAIVVACYALWSVINQEIHVRCRLTIEVKVNDQIKTGSSVIDVAYTIYPDGFLGGVVDNDAHINGYAPTVDLGEKGLLFLTFNRRSGPPQVQFDRGIRCSMSYFLCLPFIGYGRDNQVIGSNYAARKAALNDLLRENGPRDLPIESVPDLLIFTQIESPFSMEHVSPFNLAETFGPGVSLSRVIIELTTAPVSPMPEIWPLWLKAKNAEIGILRGSES